MNPMTIARFMVVGKASAWTGTIVGAAYLGIALYVVPMAGQIAAAQDDITGVVSSVLGGVAMAIAGLILERHCEVPPPTDGRSEEHTSELQSRGHLVCRPLLEKKNENE